MTGQIQFSVAAARARLGPAAVAAARRLVDAAPPLSIEQHAKLRAVFTTARRPQKAAANAA